MKHIGYLAALGRPLPRYKGPPWPQPEPEVPPTDAEVEDWRRRHPGSTCTDVVAKILCQLEREYGRRP
jgi:hypothetical protein